MFAVGHEVVQQPARGRIVRDDEGIPIRQVGLVGEPAEGVGLLLDGDVEIIFQHQRHLPAGKEGRRERHGQPLGDEGVIGNW